jgi:hypothetical protein
VRVYFPPETRYETFRFRELPWRWYPSWAMPSESA